MLKMRHNEPAQAGLITTKEHLSRHDREIAEIRAIKKNAPKKTSLKWRRRTPRKCRKLAKGTEAAREETRVIRNEIRELTAAQKRVEATLRTLIASLGGANGHRKRNVS